MQVSLILERSDLLHFHPTSFNMHIVAHVETSEESNRLTSGFAPDENPMHLGSLESNGGRSMSSLQGPPIIVGYLSHTSRDSELGVVSR